MWENGWAEAAEVQDALTPCDPTIPLLNTDRTELHARPPRDKSVHGHTLHSSPKQETTPTSTSSDQSKCTLAHSHDGTLLSDGKT